RFVPTAHERLTPTVLARMLSARTRVVAVSWVGFLDGYRHDLAGLAAVAHRGGAWLCVDAIQGLGVLPCDVDALGIDALYAGTGKWLLGLAGLGLLYLRDDLQAVVQPRWRGWRDVADIWDDFNYDQPLAQGAQRYEGGTLNFLGVHALLASLDVLEAAEIGRIGAHVLALTDTLVDGLLSIGVEIVSERGAAASGIVTFRLAGRDCVATGERLAAAGIVVTARPSGIRVSPHGYNTLAEIAALIDALGALC
ncbi:MAG: aminotransferase class V-fold PLP-dependent enzyme, partial [Vulcanimicrobiaceae bacterium]